MAIYFNGHDIDLPVKGSLSDIHNLILLLTAPTTDEQVTIDGHGYTLTVTGFKSNKTGESYTVQHLEKTLEAQVSFLLGFDESGWIDYPGAWRVHTHEHMRTVKDAIQKINSKPGEKTHD